MTFPELNIICPHCGSGPMSVATPAFEDRTFPVPGDIGICIDCAQPFMYVSGNPDVEDLMARALTVLELLTLNPETARALRRGIKAVKAFNARWRRGR